MVRSGLDWDACKTRFLKYVENRPCMEHDYSRIDPKTGDSKITTLYRCTKSAFEEGTECDHYLGIIPSKKEGSKKVVLSIHKKRLEHNECTEAESVAAKVDRISPKMILFPNGEKIVRYVADGALNRFMVKNRSMKDQRIYVRSGLEKLLCLARRGFVHRDIKVDNLLIDTQKKELLVIDFGRSCPYHKGESLMQRGDLNVFATPWEVAFTNDNIWVGELIPDIKGMGISLLHMYTDILMLYHDVVRESGFKHREIAEIIPPFHQALLDQKEELMGSVPNQEEREILEQMIYRPHEMTLEGLEIAILSLRDS